MHTMVAGERMTRRELEHWLCGPGGEREGDAFTLALLRDLLASDQAVHWWLQAQRAELGGRRAAELLGEGDTDSVERLALQEWHAAAS